MGYFSNGTEGCGYQEQYCDRCEHDRKWREAEKDPCPVWGLHLMHNGEQGPIGQLLDELIPRDSGVGNGKCRMFVPVSRLKREPREYPKRPRLIENWPKGDP